MEIAGLFVASEEYGMQIMGSIEVFRTDVSSIRDAEKMHQIISNHYPFYKINFDLSDKDRILRVVCCTHEIDLHAVIGLFEANNFKIQPLD